MVARLEVLVVVDAVDAVAQVSRHELVRPKRAHGAAAAVDAEALGGGGEKTQDEG